MNKGIVIFILLFVGCVSSCVKQDAAGYLEAAGDMIKNARLKLLQANRHWGQIHSGPMDCADLFHTGHNKSGGYLVSPVNRLFSQKSVSVYCDMDTEEGGWTVIQRRGNFSRRRDYFFQDWKSYKDGFGNIEEDFWLGNDNIFALTNQKPYSVRFDLVTSKLEKRYAQYDNFWLDDEFYNYTLHISGYKGDAGDSMEKHHEIPFSTKDRDNRHEDNICPERFKSGWWFTTCRNGNLNGPYLSLLTLKEAEIFWPTLTAYNDSLHSAEIKIRPVTFIVSDKIK